MKLKLLAIMLFLSTIQIYAQFFPNTGTRKHLVIMIEFSDMHQTATRANVDQIYNTANPNGGNYTFKSFYQEQSHNLLTVNSDVVGPIMMPQTKAWYDANNYGNDQMIVAAIAAANASVDFSQYVINTSVPIVSVLAPYFTGQTFTGGALSFPTTADGVSITGGLISETGTDSQLRLDVMCHEFGHALGLVDTYPSVPGATPGTGTQDLMGSASNPLLISHMAMVHKVCLNWVTPIVLTTAGTYTLENVESGIPKAYRINTTTPNEYYLLECRKDNVNTNGIIIWHIHKDFNCSVEPNDGYPMKLYAVSTGSTYNEPELSAASYTSGTKVFKTGASFTDFTKHWARSWADDYSDKPITNIVINATTGVATFDFMKVANMRVAAATNILANGATLNGKANAIDGSTPTTAYFQYSLDPAFVTGVTTSAAINVTSTSLTSISAPATGLTANKTYYFRVKTVNVNGTHYSDAITFYTRVITVPVNESFDASLNLPSGWNEAITVTSGNAVPTYWKVISPGSPIGIANEVSNTSGLHSAGTARLMTPPINTTGFSTLNLSFRYKGLPFAPATGYTFCVRTSTDGVTWSAPVWSIAPTALVGPATANVTLHPTTGTTYIAFGVEGDFYNAGAWYIDTVSLTSSIPTPTVTTVAANAITTTSATLNGIANAQNSSTTVTFEWGTDTSYGNTVSATPGTVNGLTNTNVTAPLSGLTLETTYHFRVRAVNAGGTVYGNDLTFVTPNGYCTSNGSNSTRYIDAIAMNGLSRNSTNDAGGYFDYTGGSASLTAGSNPALNFSQGQTDTGYWNAWIDFNGDLDFNDPGEQIVTALAKTGNGWFNQAFIVPTTAKNGMTHMRVNLGTSNGTVLPCATGATGEVEDYLVNISGGTGRMVDNTIAETNQIQLTKCILYPNPTRGLLNVQLPTNDPANLTIYNIAGQTLLRQAVINDNPVNVDRLTPGVYFMEISGTNYTDRLQFIKE